MSEVVAALTYALDITEGQPEGHGLRACLIGMRVGQELDLDDGALSDLYYALMLKDLGCSSNAARVRHLFGADDFRVKRAVKLVDLDDLGQGARFVLAHAGTARGVPERLRRVLELAFQRRSGPLALTQVRCERGADIALQMGFSQGTSAAIRALDERWDGRGHPYRLGGEAIPLLGRILGLAQSVEVFYQAGGAAAVEAMLAERDGRWFDPRVVAAFERASARRGFWETLEDDALARRVAALEPADHVLRADPEQLERVAEAFARVIDAKSPWTYRHSERVRRFALGAAAQLDEAPAPERLVRLSRAALLHDIGKLGVSNLVLDKPGALTDDEFAAIRRHPAYGERILSRVQPFRDLAPLAGGHHERMDGRGYHRGVPAASVAFDVRLLAVADQFEALTADRPYREGLSPEAAMALLREDAGAGVDPVALAALERFLGTPEAAELTAAGHAFDPDIPVPGKG